MCHFYCLVLSCLLLILLTACSLQAAPATRPAAPHVTCLSDIRYGEDPGKSNLLDVYLPDPVDHDRPLVIWIHGGGWAEGSKLDCPAIPLVSQGFVVASLNYRLSGEAAFPAQIQDCKGAIRFLRAHAAQYHIDPDKIGVWGASAGGHLAALLGTSAGAAEVEGTVGGNLDQSSRVQAVCDWFGPTDLTQFAAQAKAAGILNQTAGPVLIMQLFAGSLEEKKDLVRVSNPIAFIGKKPATDLPRFLIMHGDRDKTVPVAQSRLLYDALKTAGVKVDLQIIPGAGHGTGFYSPDIAKTLIDFFRSALKPR